MTIRTTGFALLCLLALLVAQEARGEPGRYSAVDSLRRAGVGTSSPVLAPPVRVVSALPEDRPEVVRRVECYKDPSQPLRGVIICETKETARP